MRRLKKSTLLRYLIDYQHISPLQLRYNLVTTIKSTLPIENIYLIN